MQRRKTGGIFNIVSFSPYIFSDFFSSFFLFMAFGKKEDEKLEKMRKRLNRMVWFIYSFILLIVTFGIIIKYIKG